MINLLANERKLAISAARANVIITRYTGIIILAFLFISASLYVSYSVLQSTMTSATSLIETNDVKAEVYSDTQQKVAALSDQLSETKTILNQEVRYSELLVQIGQLMPQGAVLGNLTLTTSSLRNTPIEIKAYARSTAEASALQSRFQSSPIFREATIEGTNSTDGIDGYPVAITMKASLNR